MNFRKVPGNTAVLWIKLHLPRQGRLNHRLLKCTVNCAVFHRSCFVCVANGFYPLPQALVLSGSVARPEASQLWVISCAYFPLVVKSRAYNFLPPYKQVILHQPVYLALAPLRLPLLV